MSDLKGVQAILTHFFEIRNFRFFFKFQSETNQSFLSHSKQRLDEVTVLQRRIQDDIKSSSFNVKTILEFCQCFIDAFEDNKSAFYI